MKAHRLLNIDRGDFPTLGALAPVFALAAAVTIVLASLSKALFLSQNPIELLPWMFLGSAGMTAFAALGYLWLLDRLPLRARAHGVLLLGALSVLALRVTFATEPRLAALIALLWCPALGNLIVLQTWNIASSTLPTRQGKRLFPVLAAIATSGAVLGGLLVQGGLLFFPTEDLLILCAVLLLLAAARVGPTTARASAASGAAPGPEPDSSQQPRGLSVILGSAMLTEVALLVFLLQAASLIVDYQFSAELQPRFDKEGIARFLGTFYWVSNLVVLLVTLFATSRLVRAVGIGLALSASGVVLAVGSLTYVAANFNAALSSFWVVAATAFVERVAQFALTKPAMQMVYMPVQGRGGERAKALIDGVVNRLASALVSLLLLLATPSVANQFRLSPPAVLACVVVVYLGYRFGPHYRRAVFEALEARRLDPVATLMLRDGLGGDTPSELQEQLSDPSPRRIQAALEIAVELRLPLAPARLEALSLHEDPRVVIAALDAMRGLGREPRQELLAAVLAPGRPPGLLRSVLEYLAEHRQYALPGLARPLVAHPDPAVSSAAVLARLRATDDAALVRFEGEVAAGSVVSPAAVDGPRPTGITRAGAFARELPALLAGADPKVRLQAIEQMGQLGLPSFIDPLIACLTDSDLREAVVAALVRYQGRVVDRAAENAREPSLGLPARIALLHVLEGVGTEGAVTALVGLWGGSSDLSRDHAVQALWRIAAHADAPQPSAAELVRLLRSEIDRLRRLALIEVRAVSAPTPRTELFASELRGLQRRGERRAFWLLGILYDRAAIQRAQQHLRSRDPRVRSNAFELLEQHIAEPGLRPFVDLIEGAESADGARQPRSLILQPSQGSGPVDELLGQESLLLRVWHWAQRRGPATLDWNDPLDRALRIKDIPMFRSVSGDGLLELASNVGRAEFAAGEVLYRQGDQGRDVLWLLHGHAERVGFGAGGALLGPHDCLGMVEALDGGRRAATVRATTALEVMSLSAGGFQAAVQLSPQVLQSAIVSLSRVLRGGGA